MLPHRKTLNELSTLKKADEKILLAFIKASSLHSDTKEDFEKLIKQIGGLHLNSLYALSESNPVMRELLDHNTYLNSVWLTLLKKINYPQCEFVSSDKQCRVSLFSQLKGAVLLTELEKYDGQYDQKALEILDKACDLGMYDALIKRLTFYKKFIAENISNPKNRELVDSYGQYITKDIEKITKLYGSMAHIDSALILFALAQIFLKQEAHRVNFNYFFTPVAANKFSWIESYHKANAPLPVILFEASTQHLYMAELLENEPVSKTAAAQLLHSNNLLTGITGDYSDANQFKAQVRAKLTAIGIPLVDTFCAMSADAAKEQINTPK